MKFLMLYINWMIFEIFEKLKSIGSQSEKILLH